MARERKSRKGTDTSETKMTTPDTITFDAEIKKVSSKKLASLDMEYQLILSSQDENMFSLGLLDASKIITVTVEVA